MYIYMCVCVNIVKIVPQFDNKMFESWIYIQEINMIYNCLGAIPISFYQLSKYWVKFQM